MAASLSATEARALWLDHLANERRSSPRTLEAYGFAAARYIAFLERHRGETLTVASLAEVGAGEVRAWLAHLRAGDHPLSPRSLSQALGQQPRVFPPLYVALVQSSERTGALGDALARYISYRQRLDLVRQKLVGASVYPMLLLLVGGGVVLFLLGYVVPRFSQVFEGMGTELPWLSRLLMQIGLFLHAQQLPLALGALGAATALLGEKAAMACTVLPRPMSSASRAPSSSCCRCCSQATPCF